MSLNNGVLSKPISIGEISSCLGHGSLDVGTLCTSTQINQKSKHKPVEYNSTGELSEETRAGLNYGHTLNSYNTAPQAINAVKAGTNFPYNRPNTWYRILDFDGYDANAGDWYPCAVLQTTISTSTTYIEFNMQIDAIFELGSLAAYKGTANIQFGFILKQASDFTTTESNVYWYPLTDANTLISSVSDKVRMLASAVRSVASGTWYAYPCLTTAVYAINTMHYVHDESAGYQWFPYPFSNSINFTLSTSGGGGGGSTVISNIDVIGSAWEMTQVGTSNYFDLSEVYVEVTNYNSSAQTITLEAYVTTKTGTIYLEGARITSLAANTSQTVRIQKEALRIGEFESADSVFCTVEYTVGSATNRMSFNLAEMK